MGMLVALCQRSVNIRETQRTRGHGEGQIQTGASVPFAPAMNHLCRYLQFHRVISGRDFLRCCPKPEVHSMKPSAITQRGLNDPTLALQPLISVASATTAASGRSARSKIALLHRTRFIDS